MVFIFKYSSIESTDLQFGCKSVLCYDLLNVSVVLDVGDITSRIDRGNLHKELFRKKEEDIAGSGGLRPTAALQWPGFKLQRCPDYYGVVGYTYH